MLSTELYAIILYQFQVLCGKSVESHKEHGQLPPHCGLTASTVNGCSKWLQRLQANCKVASDICQFFMCTYCISLLTDNRDRKEDNVMIEFAVYWIAFHYLTYIIY